MVAVDHRHLFARLWVSLTLLPLTCAAAARPYGGRDGVIALRYHFAVGQRLLYRVTTTRRVTTTYASGGNLATSPAGSQARFSPVTETSIVRAQVIRVATTGTATITQATYRVGGALTLDDAERFTLAPDGTQRGIDLTPRTSVTSPLALPLPRGPVRLGAHWTSPILLVPARIGRSVVLSRRITVDYTLIGVGIAGGEPVAIIRGVAHGEFHAVTTVTLSSHAVRQQEDEVMRVTERALFGLTSGDLVARDARTESALTVRYWQPGEADVLRIQVVSHTRTQWLAS